MFTKSAQVISLASALTVLTAGYAYAQINARSASVSMRGEVPLVCRVAFTPLPGNATQGETVEFCNNAAGYTLFARATGNANGAALIVNGVPIPLISGQDVAIGGATGPAQKTSSISIDPSQANQLQSLTLRIQAN